MNVNKAIYYINNILKRKIVERTNHTGNHPRYRYELFLLDNGKVAHYEDKSIIVSYDTFKCLDDYYINNKEGRGFGWEENYPNFDERRIIYIDDVIK